jgi:tetratricopeptide (TPR) repeat protein
MRTPLMLAAFCLPLAMCAQYLADNTQPNDSEKIFKAGERAYRNGDLALAINLFDRVLEREPDHINAYLQRGFSYSLNKEYERAVQDFSAVIHRKEDHLWAYISRGSALIRLERHAEAVADLNMVLVLDPRNEEAYNNRGWAHKGLNDLEAACKDWKSSQRLGNAEARIILSNTRCK